MPQKTLTQKTLLKMLDEAIIGLRRRVTYLNGKYEGFLRAKENNNAPFVNDDILVEISEQIEAAKGQLEYLLSVKKEFEDLLNRLKDDRERKERMEYILRCAIMIGIITENLRVETERDTQRDHELVRGTDLETSVDLIFKNNKYKYVTRDMVKEIINNPEFKEMAEKDPDKLVKEEADLKEEYDLALEQALRIAGIQIEDDFEANEEKLKVFLEDHNGYSLIFEKLKYERYSNFLEWGEDADKEFMREMKSRFEELETETKTLEQQFITGESDFKKGNGYTKELIEKESNLLERIISYRDSLLNDRIMKKLTEGEAPTQDELMLYELARTLEFQVSEQLKRDKVFEKNNSFRKKLEMWDVYKKIPEGQRINIVELSEKVRLEGRAWSKIQRMERLAAKKGGMFADTTKWAVNAAQRLLEIANERDAGELTEEKKNELKENMAILIVNRIIYNESVHLGAYDDRPYSDELKKEVTEKKFKQIATNLFESKEYRLFFDDLFRNIPRNEIALRFLAGDMEKEFARRLPKKLLQPERREERARDFGL